MMQRYQLYLISLCQISTIFNFYHSSKNLPLFSVFLLYLISDCINIPIGLQLFPFIRNSFVRVGNSVEIRDIQEIREQIPKSLLLLCTDSIEKVLFLCFSLRATSYLFNQIKANSVTYSKYLLVHTKYPII